MSDCTIGTITGRCQICVAVQYFDRLTYQTAFQQAMASGSYTIEEARQQAQSAAIKTRGRWTSYNDIYKCTDCQSDRNKTGPVGNIEDDEFPPNIFRSTEAERMLKKECKSCEEEVIPSSVGLNKITKYRAKYTGGVDPKSCDLCVDGAIRKDYECEVKNDTERDIGEGPLFQWEASYSLGECECVKRCVQCAECEKCIDRDTKGNQKCVSNCPEGPSYKCMGSQIDGYSCICKYVANTSWNNTYESQKHTNGWIRCSASTPHVEACECVCNCPGDNMVCATNDGEFLGCRCKYVSRDDYNAMFGAKGTGYFNGAVPCDETIRATDNGGCSCGYTIANQSIFDTLNLIP